MSTITPAPAASTIPAKPGRRLPGWLLLATIIAAAAVGIAFGIPDTVKETVSGKALPWLAHLLPARHPTAADEGPAASATSEEPVGKDASRGPWDGSVTFSPSQQKAIGVRTVAVLAQTEPLQLELQGKTDYNPDTLVKIRPRFDALVLAVHATVGQRVKKGDPLVNLYSVRLAEAKLEYESKQSQAEHDRQIAMHQRDLVAKGVIPDSSRVLLDAVNLERRSLLEFKLARDELEVFGVPPEEIENVHSETGTEKAKMTLRAPSDGTIVARDVAVGNIYDPKDTLLTVASIEELWVWGSVYERDLANVRQGLEWEVHFPFTRESVDGTVEYVSNQVDPQTHAVRIRGSIPNADGHFKSDQLVRVIVKCPPKTGNTVIPRRAVVTNAGDCFVFVQRPAAPDTFERRSVEIEHEFSDHVIVASGLKPGEMVVTTGSLVMTQVYEDQLAVETGEAM
jgi:cobalt-zinc-cadmium efflux system membrane fusion protein